MLRGFVRKLSEKSDVSDDKWIVEKGFDMTDGFSPKPTYRADDVKIQKVYNFVVSSSSNNMGGFSSFKVFESWKCWVVKLFQRFLSEV